MTVLDLAVYMFLFALVTGLVLSMLQFMRTTSDTTTSAYLVNGNTETALRILRQDLEETALASIAIAPTGGLSMVSSRAYNGDEYLTNQHGGPRWDKHVLYTLNTKPGSLTGNLVRWEREIQTKNLLPLPCPVGPGSPPTDHQQVVLRDVVAPNSALPGVGLTASSWGGFRTEFVRRQGGEDGPEVLTTENPTQGDPHDNTRLLEVELQIYQANGARSNYYALELRVAPRH